MNKVFKKQTLAVAMYSDPCASTLIKVSSDEFGPRCQSSIKINSAFIFLSSNWEAGGGQSSILKTFTTIKRGTESHEKAKVHQAIY